MVIDDSVSAVRSRGLKPVVTTCATMEKEKKKGKHYVRALFHVGHGRA